MNTAVAAEAIYALEKMREVGGAHPHQLPGRETKALIYFGVMVTRPPALAKNKQRRMCRSGGGASVCCRQARPPAAGGIQATKSPKSSLIARGGVVGEGSDMHMGK